MYFLVKLAFGLVVLAIGYGVYGIYVWSAERQPARMTFDQYFRAGERPRWVILSDCVIDPREGFRARLGLGWNREAWFIPIRQTGKSGPARLVLQVRSPERIRLLEQARWTTTRSSSESSTYQGPIEGLVEFTGDKTRDAIVKAGGKSIASDFDVLTEDKKPQLLLPSLSLLAGLGAAGGLLWYRFRPAPPPPPRPPPADPQRYPAARSLREMIEQTRQIAGRPPRNIALFGGLMLPPPAWLRPRCDDRLHEIYQMESTLLRDGQIVWGHLVQANKQLFEPGDTDCPAAILYSTDPYFDGQPDELGELADGLYELKGEKTEPDVQLFADLLQDELSRAMRLPLPPRVTGGYEVIYTDIMVRRKDLPTGQISGSFFPLLIVPAKTDATLILPWEWWSPALVARWRE